MDGKFIDRLLRIEERAQAAESHVENATEQAEPALEAACATARAREAVPDAGAVPETDDADVPTPDLDEPAPEADDADVPTPDLDEPVPEIPAVGAISQEMPEPDLDLDEPRANRSLDLPALGIVEQELPDEDGEPDEPPAIEECRDLDEVSQTYIPASLASEAYTPTEPAKPEPMLPARPARPVEMPPEKPRKRHRVLKGILIALLILVLYTVLGALIGPLVLPQSTLGAEALPAGFGTTACTDRALYIGADKQEALDWRLKTIASAQKSVDYSSFDLRNDESGHDVMAALYDAAERGVHVRIINDGLLACSGLIFDPMFSELRAHPNVEVRYYNAPNILTPWTLNYRMHEKTVVADGTVAIVGGRNSMDYFLGSYGDVAKVEREILVYAPNGAGNSSFFEALERHFGYYWEIDACTDGLCLAFAQPSPSLTDRWRNLVKGNESVAAFIKKADWGSVTEPVDDIAFITGGIEATNKSPLLWKSLCAIAAEGKSIIIQTPYIMLSDEMYADLSVLSASRDVTLITNDIADHTNSFGTMDLIHEHEAISATGATLVEADWEQFVHAKTWLIDDDLCLIGSFNCDARSAYLDTECMAVIKSTAISERVADELEEGFAAGYVHQPDGSDIVNSGYNLEARAANSAYWDVMSVITHPFRYLF